MKFEWIRDRKDLRAIRKFGTAPVHDYSNPGYDLSEYVTEEDMLEVAQWCCDAQCGRRMSFDTFRFKRREDITVFL